VARYLILMFVAALVACTVSTSGDGRAVGDFPELRSARLQVSEVREPAAYVAPEGSRGLAAFAERLSVTDGERARLGDFEVLYHAPNRNPAVAAPYLPESVPDRLMITVHGDVFVEESIPTRFAGTQGQRAIDVAAFDVKGRHYLLVASGGAARAPRWFAIVDDGGKLLYRAATAHGAYRFVRQADGISMVDDAGYGKRFSVL